VISLLDSVSLVLFIFTRLRR